MSYFQNTLFYNVQILEILKQPLHPDSDINRNCTCKLPALCNQTTAFTNSLNRHIQSTCFSLEKLSWKQNIKKLVDSHGECMWCAFMCVGVKLIHPEWVCSVRSVFLMNRRGTTSQALARTPLTAVQTSSSCCCQWLKVEPTTHWLILKPALHDVYVCVFVHLRYDWPTEQIGRYTCTLSRALKW